MGNYTYFWLICLLPRFGVFCIQLPLTTVVLIPTLWLLVVSIHETIFCKGASAWHQLLYESIVNDGGEERHDCCYCQHWFTLSAWTPRQLTKTHLDRSIPSVPSNIIPVLRPVRKLVTGNKLLPGGEQEITNNDVVCQFCIFTYIFFLTSAAERGRRFLALFSLEIACYACQNQYMLSGEREQRDTIATAANINLRLSIGLTHELTYPFRNFESLARVVQS